MHILPQGDLFRMALVSTADPHSSSVKMLQESCPVCSSTDLEIFFRSDHVPINCSALWSSVEEARHCARGRIHLAHCAGCDLVFNATFDGAMMRYNDLYENSLSSSPTFQSYRAELVKHLCDTYQLRGKHIVEIGCGAGMFLKQLCAWGDNVATGYDPSLPSHAVSDSVL